MQKMTTSSNSINWHLTIPSLDDDPFTKYLYYSLYKDILVEWVLRIYSGSHNIRPQFLSIILYFSSQYNICICSDYSYAVCTNNFGILFNFKWTVGVRCDGVSKEIKLGYGTMSKIGLFFLFSYFCVWTFIWFYI